ENSRLAHPVVLVNGEPAPRGKCAHRCLWYDSTVATATGHCRYSNTRVSDRAPEGRLRAPARRHAPASARGLLHGGAPGGGGRPAPHRGGGFHPRRGPPGEDAALRARGDP